MCQDVADYQDAYELPTRTFSDRQIEDIIYRAAGKCSEQVVETVNRQFTIISNRIDGNDQEVARISSQVSIMEGNSKSHSEVQLFSDSKMHERKPILRDSELCCEVSMTQLNAELVSEGKKNFTCTRPRSAGAVSRRKKSHLKEHDSLVQTELKVLRNGKLC